MRRDTRKHFFVEFKKRRNSPAHKMSIPGSPSKKDYEDAALFMEFVRMVNSMGTGAHRERAEEAQGCRPAEGEAGAPGGRGPGAQDRILPYRARTRPMERPTIPMRPFSLRRPVHHLSPRYGPAPGVSSALHGRCSPEEIPFRMASMEMRQRGLAARASMGTERPLLSPYDQDRPGPKLPRGITQSLREERGFRHARAVSPIEETGARGGLKADSMCPPRPFYQGMSHRDPGDYSFRPSSPDRVEDAFRLNETAQGFACQYCEAKYIYKRCLVNHLLKSHRKLIKGSKYTALSMGDL